MGSYAERKAEVQHAARRGGTGTLGLAKGTSNLFRDRARVAKRRLDVASFNHVLEVRPDEGWMEVEGMTEYEAAVDEALRYDVMPAVVPELKTITVGGAAAGVGIEATSFRHGLVHETVMELEVLLGDGTVVLATPDNEHADLFFGFPNSYGTLGYALRLRVKTIPVKPFVRVDRTAHGTPGELFDALAAACASQADFVDGVVFGRGVYYLNVARFADEAPYTSNYTFEQIYYRSIPDKPTDYLTTADYLWRWDTDWFWCSKNVYAQVPLIRRIYGRSRLGSRTYQRIMRWNSRIGLTRLLDRLAGRRSESVIQDVDIPIGRAAEFLEFMHREIPLSPLWICPIGTTDRGPQFAMFPLPAGETYVNFGFWDTISTRGQRARGHYNRLVEQEVARLGGIKSLYSESYYPEAEFWTLFNRDAYRSLKARYDPSGALGDLYRKTVLGH